MHDILDRLVPVSGDSVAERLDAVTARMATLGSPPLAGTPFSADMLAAGLALQRWRVSHEEIERALPLAPPRLAGSPRATAIVSAGNVPLLAASDVVWSLLAGDRVAVKLSRRESALTRWFVEAFPDHVAALEWRGGDIEREEPALSWADRLIVYGSDETVAAVRARYPGPAFQGFGHRVSMAWVPLACPWPMDELGDRLATDVALWDQEGCLSPHAVLVEPGVDVDDVAAALAASLARLETVVPRGALPFETRAAVRSLTLDTEARMLTRSNVDVIQGERAAWTVIVDPDPVTLVSPLGRTVRVVSVADARETLRPYRGRLQSIGVAVPGVEGADDDPFLEAARELEVTRVCVIGRMQQPSATWFGEERSAPSEPPCVDVDFARDGVWRWLRGEEAPRWFPRRFSAPSV